MSRIVEQGIHSRDGQHFVEELQSPHHLGVSEIEEGDHFEVELILQHHTELSDVVFRAMKVIEIITLVVLIAYQESHLLTSCGW